jgi:hypothetical protein
MVDGRGHCGRYSQHREEFAQHGLGSVVAATCRDVCAEGFGLDTIVDAGMYVM